MTDSLEGRCAVVTGSGRGIGASIAIKLAAAGCNVVVNARASASDAESVAEQARHAGADTIVVMADVSNPEDVRKLAALSIERFGHIDILVNNVGISPMMELDKTTDELWRMVIDTSLSSAFYCTREFIAGMRDRRWGRVINIGGQAGIRGTKYKTANSAAKAGIIGLTRAISNEYASFGVTCNHIGPGHMTSNHELKYYPDSTLNLEPDRYNVEASSKIPVGRVGSPEEIAAMCRFLVSEDAAYITGQTILVNGGILFT
jgi:3-oxoacyl-[acyl-carrier protein] reductase